MMFVISYSQCGESTASTSCFDTSKTVSISTSRHIYMLTALYFFFSFYVTIRFTLTMSAIFRSYSLPKIMLGLYIPSWPIDSKVFLQKPYSFLFLAYALKNLVAYHSCYNFGVYPQYYVLYHCVINFMNGIYFRNYRKGHKDRRSSI